MKLLQFNEGKNNTVTALFRVIQDGVKTRRNGLPFDYEAAKIAVNSYELQENIRIGALFLHDQHPRKLYDKKGRPVSPDYFSNQKVAKVTSMFADDQDKSIKMWVEYLDNDAGKIESDLIRNGKKPFVSVVDFERIVDGKNHIDEIISIDFVSIPNVPNATLITYNNFDIMESENTMDKLKQFLLKYGITSQSIMDFASNKAKSLTNNSAIMSLEEILGQAKNGWLSTEAIMSLEIQIDLAKKCAEELASLKAKMDSTTDETIKSEIEIEMNGLQNAVNSMSMDLAPAISGLKSQQEMAYNNILGFKPTSVTPITNNDNNSNIASMLMDKINFLSSKIDNIQVSNKTNNTDKIVTFNSKEYVDNLFNQSSKVLKVNNKEYDFSKYGDIEINALKYNGVNGKDEQDCNNLIQIGLEQLEKSILENAMKNIGFNPNDIQNNLKTNGISNKKEDKEMGLYEQTRNKLQMTFNSLIQSRKPQWVNRKNKLGSRVKEQLEKFVLYYNDLEKETINQINNLSSELTQNDFHYNGDENNQQSWNNWLKSNFKSASSASELTQNDFNQAPTTALNAVITPSIRAEWRIETLQRLDALEFVTALTPNQMRVSERVNGNDFGRVLNVGNLFINDVSSYDEADHRIDESGVTVLDEATFNSTRQEFLKQDFALAMRYTQNHAKALKTADAAMDLVAVLMMVNMERLNRQRDTRIYRHLFREASLFNCKRKTDQAVAAIAPSGAGKKVYKGEYKFVATNLAITIGGKTFCTDGDGSNIRAVVRVLGSNTSDTSFFNVPIVEQFNGFTVDNLGNFETVIENEVILKIDGVKLTQGRKSVNSDGVINVVDGDFYVDYDGFIVIKSGTDATADPTDPPILVSYDEVTNYVPFNINNGTTPSSEYYNKYFDVTSTCAADMAAKPNYASGVNAVLQDQRIGNLIRKSSIFHKQISPNGANLSKVYSQDLFICEYGNLSYFGVNGELPYQDRRALIFQLGHTQCMFETTEFSDAYRIMRTNPVDGKQKATNELGSDIMESMCLATPRMINPKTNKQVNCPYKLVIFYDDLPTFED